MGTFKKVCVTFDFVIEQARYTFCYPSTLQIF